MCTSMVVKIFTCGTRNMIKKIELSGLTELFGLLAALYSIGLFACLYINYETLERSVTAVIVNVMV